MDPTLDPADDAPPTRLAAFFDRFLMVLWIVLLAACFVTGFYLLVEAHTYVSGVLVLVATVGAISGGEYLLPVRDEADIDAYLRGEPHEGLTPPRESLRLRFGRAAERSAAPAFLVVLGLLDVLAIPWWGLWALAGLAVVTPAIEL